MGGGNKSGPQKEAMNGRTGSFDSNTRMAVRLFKDRVNFVLSETVLNNKERFEDKFCVAFSHACLKDMANQPADEYHREVYMVQNDGESLEGYTPVANESNIRGPAKAIPYDYCKYLAFRNVTGNGSFAQRQPPAKRAARDPAATPIFGDTATASTDPANEQWNVIIYDAYSIFLCNHRGQCLLVARDSVIPSNL